MQANVVCIIHLFTLIIYLIHVSRAAATEPSAYARVRYVSGRAAVGKLCASQCKHTRHSASAAFGRSVGRSVGAIYTQFRMPHVRGLWANLYHYPWRVRAQHQNQQRRFSRFDSAAGRGMVGGCAGNEDVFYVGLALCSIAQTSHRKLNYDLSHTLPPPVVMRVWGRVC